MNREPTTAADYDAGEAVEMLAHDGDEVESPDLDDRGSSTRVDYGPNDHTCGDHPKIGCHVCARTGVPA